MSGRLLTPYYLDPPPKPAGPPPPTFALGVGLGRAGGAAACAVVERSYAAAETEAEPHYLVRHLMHWAPGQATYARMAAEVAAVLRQLEQEGDQAVPVSAPRLLVDVGVSDMVCDYFREASRDLAWFRGLQVVSEPSPGLTAVEGTDWIKVSVAELAGAVLGLTQQGRLQVGDVPQAGAVVAALRSFGARAAEFGRVVGIPFGNAPNEELLVAVSAPCWLGECFGPPLPMPKPVPEPERDPRLRLTPRHGSAAERRRLFGAQGPDDEGYLPA